MTIGGGNQAGRVGIGQNPTLINTSRWLLATLDVRPNIQSGATIAIASFSGSTNFAALVTDNTGTGDLFTASKSGATKFTVLNSGNLQFAGTTNFLTTLASAATSARTITFPDATGTLCLQGSTSCGFALGTNYLQLNSNLLSPINSTWDFAIGATATTSAKFAFTGLSSATNQTIASISGNLIITPNNGFGGRIGVGTENPGANWASLSTGIDIFPGNNRIATLGLLSSGGNGGIINFGSNSSYSLGAQIGYNYNVSGGLEFCTNSDASAPCTTSSSRLLITNTGRFGISNLSPLATLDVRPNNIGGGTLAIASVSGSTSFAALVVDNTNANGDLFTASKSGATKFVIANSGNVGIGTANPGIGVGGTSWNASGTVFQFSNPIGGARMIIDGNTPILNYVENDQAVDRKISAWFVQSGILSLNAYNDDATARISNILVADLNSGKIGLGTSSPTSELYVTRPLSFGATGKALAIFDQIENQDIFTASSSGVAKFAIGINGELKVGSGVPSAGSLNNCLLSGGAGAAPSWGSCSAGAGDGTSNWTINSSTGVLRPNNNTLDLILGGVATASAKFQFTNMISGNPTLKIYNSTSVNSLNLYHDGTDAHIDTSAGELILGSGAGNVIIENSLINDTSNNAGALTISDKLFVQNTESSVALAVFNNLGAGDLFTASSSGTSRFTITSAGGFKLGTNEGSSGECIKSGGAGAAVTWGTCGGSSGAAGTWEISSANGVHYPINNAIDALLGGASSSSAAFKVTGQGNPLKGTLVAASVSADTSFAGFVVDNKGVGDIFTASSAGMTRFTVKQSGAVVIGDAINGMTFNPNNSGPVYSGSGRPVRRIILSPEYAGAVITASTSAAFSGTMTSDASTSASLNLGGTTNNFLTYYEWTSSQTSLNDYTVAVRVTLPADFSSWAPGGAAMQVAFNTELTTSNSNKLDLLISDMTSGNVVYRQAQTSSSVKTWKTIDVSAEDLGNGTPWNTASQSAMIYLKMYSKDNNYVQIGDIILNYLSKF